MSKYYKYFVPTVTFHFDVQPSKINIIEFLKLLEKEMIIVDIEIGSTFITIAFILSNKSRDFNKKYRDAIQKVRDKLATPLGTPIIGNIVDEPILNIPEDQHVEAAIKDKLINLLQNTEFLNSIDLNVYKSKVCEMRRKVDVLLTSEHQKNFEVIFNQFKLFGEAEEQVRVDIMNSEIELVIIGSTIIANKYFNEYDQIRSEIIHNKENVIETFVYHGTQIKNQQSIVNHHYLMPGQDSVKRRDEGYFGDGIYATDSIYYSTMYSLKIFDYLKFKEKASVICCRAIYSENQVRDVVESDSTESTSDEDMKRRYGINRSLVGSSKKFNSIDESQKDKSFVFAKEIVFPNKFQIIPIASFTVMRTEFFILWVDESKIHFDLFNVLKQEIFENFYFADSVELSKSCAKIKKRNRMKLILSFTDVEFAKRVIDEIREITKSKTVCLIFSDQKNQEQIDFALMYENVLYTSEISYLKQYCNIEMTSTNMVKLSQTLNGKNFNVNESTIIDFRLFKTFQ